MEWNLFDKQVYKNRRQRLMQQVGSGLILLNGNEDSSMNYRDNCYPFRQDSSFLYYFGIDLPGFAGVLDCETGEEFLFGPEPSLDDIIWTGPQPSVPELAAKVGVANGLPFARVEEKLREALAPGRRIHLLPPYRPENKIRMAAWLSVPLFGLDAFVSKELVLAVIAQRAHKEAVEIAELEEAVSISADMHLAAIRQARPGMKEYELAAMVEEVALAANGRLSYPVILSIHGQILHNHYHGNTMKEGDMVLCDAGAENKMHYAGDLTRTFPAGKQFTTVQKELYDIVLHSLEHAASLLRPGIRFRDVHAQASLKLLEGLKQVALVKGDPAEALEAGAHTMFFQCGLGHMMGLDVHDMEDLGEEYVGYGEGQSKSKEFGWKSLRLGRELEEGYVLTVEPGIYIIPELIDRWKAEQKCRDFIDYSRLEKFRGFGGIRIEDNYLVTAGGSRKLGKDLPRTAADIETLRQSW